MLSCRDPRQQGPHGEQQSSKLYDQSPIDEAELGAWEYSSCDSETEDDDEPADTRLRSYLQRWPATADADSSKVEQEPQESNRGENLLPQRPAELAAAQKSSKASQASLENREHAHDAK